MSAGRWQVADGEEHTDRDEREQCAERGPDAGVNCEDCEAVQQAVGASAEEESGSSIE